MSSVTLIDGEANVDACLDERAFQYGDGLFETIAIVDQMPCLWEAHARRLSRGCQVLRLPLPDLDLMREEAMRLSTGMSRGVLKLYWTAGLSRRGYRRPDPVSPRRMLRVSDWPSLRPAPWRLRLCRHRLAEQPRLAGIKHLNRLDQVIARAEWNDDAIDEGLMRGLDGRIVCGTMTNLFVQRDGRLRSPALDRSGVGGVVRELLIELARRDERAVELADLDIEDVRRADALYVSNSLIGIRRVACLDAVEYDLGVAEHPTIAAARTACHRPAPSPGSEA